MLALLLLISMMAIALSMPLDDYVWRHDDAYGWVEMPEHRISGKVPGGLSWVGYTLNMTSQRWLTDADFSESSNSKSLWWHYLIVIVPSNVQWTRNATLWITGGSVTDGPPSADSEDIVVSATLAMASGIVTGALFQIPNEHTTFALDPIQKSRTEDAIIAFTWDHFLKDPSQPEWLVRFPMVKASVRAMDAMKEFCQQSLPELKTSLDYFVVSGASKRGWTTWLVGAVDPARVMVIVPIVLDAINFVAVEHHQWRSYNGWSWALTDYTDMGLMSELDTPNMLLLQQNEDPFFFRDRLTMPKLIVNAVLDEFQQPDDTRYWWNDMPEPKHFIMTPNAEHSEATGILEIVPAITAYVQIYLGKQAVPQFKWTISNTTGEIVATLNEHGTVHEVNVWWAYSCGNNAADGVKRRDFRIASIDNPCHCGISAQGYCANLKSFWNKTALEETIVRGHRTYSAKLDAPSDGRWIAYFIEVTYNRALPIGSVSEPGTDVSIGKRIPPIPHDFAFRPMFTSEVSVWPNTFPYADCSGSHEGTMCTNQIV